MHTALQYDNSSDGLNYESCVSSESSLGRASLIRRQDWLRMEAK